MNRNRTIEQRLDAIEQRLNSIELMLAAVLDKLDASPDMSLSVKEHIASGLARGLTAAEIIAEHNARAEAKERQRKGRKRTIHSK